MELLEVEILLESSFGLKGPERGLSGGGGDNRSTAKRAPEVNTIESYILFSPYLLQGFI
jgi:hypothetical protein